MAEAKKKEVSERADPEQKEVAEKPETNVSTVSLFEADAESMGEVLDQDDVKIPFLKIDKDNGTICQEVTGQQWSSEEGVTVIPCAYQRVFIEWAPRGTGPGAPVNIFQKDEPRPETKRDPSTNKDMIVDGGGNYIEETHQHFVLIKQGDGNLEAALIAMKSTQLKKSRAWNTVVSSRTMQGANGIFKPPRFAYTYKLTTQHENNTKGDWWGWSVELGESLAESNQVLAYQQAREFAKSIRAGDVVVKHEQEGDDDSSSDDVPW